MEQNYVTVTLSIVDDAGMHAGCPYAEQGLYNGQASVLLTYRQQRQRPAGLLQTSIDSCRRRRSAADGGSVVLRADGGYAQHRLV